MQFKSALLALGLAIVAAPLSAPLSAQIVPRDPGARRPGTSGTISDIIFGDSRTDTSGTCRVRDARTPDGPIFQICGDRGGRKSHVNDLDGDGDFAARDRAIRKR